LDTNTKYCYLLLVATGNPPCPRAAHATTVANRNKMVTYGGAIGGKSD